MSHNDGADDHAHGTLRMRKSMNGKTISPLPADAANRGRHHTHSVVSDMLADMQMSTNNGQLTTMVACGASKKASCEVHICYMQVLMSGVAKGKTVQNRVTIRSGIDSQIANTAVIKIKKHFLQIVA